MDIKQSNMFGNFLMSVLLQALAWEVFIPLSHISNVPYTQIVLIDS